MVLNTQNVSGTNVLAPDSTGPKAPDISKGTIRDGVNDYDVEDGKLFARETVDGKTTRGAQIGTIDGEGNYAISGQDGTRTMRTGNVHAANGVAYSAVNAQGQTLDNAPEGEVNIGATTLRSIDGALFNSATNQRVGSLENDGNYKLDATFAQGAGIPQAGNFKAVEGASYTLQKGASPSFQVNAPTSVSADGQFTQAPFEVAGQQVYAQNGRLYDPETNARVGSIDDRGRYALTGADGALQTGNIDTSTTPIMLQDADTLLQHEATVGGGFFPSVQTSTSVAELGSAFVEEPPIVGQGEQVGDYLGRNVPAGFPANATVTPDYVLVPEGQGAALSIYPKGVPYQAIQVGEDGNPKWDQMPEGVQRIWGDPHMVANRGTDEAGKPIIARTDFTRDSIMELSDGTQLFADTTSESGRSVLQAVDVINHGDRVKIAGINSGNPQVSGVTGDGYTARADLLSENAGRPEWVIGTDAWLQRSATDRNQLREVVGSHYDEAADRYAQDLGDQVYTVDPSLQGHFGSNEYQQRLQQDLSAMVNAGAFSVTAENRSAVTNGLATYGTQEQYHWNNLSQELTAAKAESYSDVFGQSYNSGSVFAMNPYYQFAQGYWDSYLGGQGYQQGALTSEDLLGDGQFAALYNGVANMFQLWSPAAGELAEVADSQRQYGVNRYYPVR